VSRILRVTRYVSRFRIVTFIYLKVHTTMPEISPVAERFIRYAKINTQSDAASKTCPSTAGQLDLAKAVLQDLTDIGCSGVMLDHNGYVMATLESNVSREVPVIGFIAHFDTSPDYSGREVRPEVVYGYQGGDIPLGEGRVRLSPDDFPELLSYIGQDLIVTDGTTLLGADDKAGVTEIVEAARYLVEHPEIPHGKIRFGFTPDEEIGRGADRFDVRKFGADFAYTIDGGGIGELEFENFNAAAAVIHIQGRNVHPGTAKGKMINALQLASDLHTSLPADERPEKTDGYEGFFHLTHLEGTVEQARMEYILRDHDFERFTARKNLLAGIVARLNTEFPAGTVKAVVHDQYFNMKEKIMPVYHIIELAAAAMQTAGVEPVIIPIRGGTDGSKLSYMGLPTPNLFSGGHNFHGRFEFIPVQSMQKAVEVIVNIARLAAK
jgi:tripeptide aminopeptidase